MEWAAELHDVLEVTIVGRSDLALWTVALRGHDLTPIERDGHAEMRVIAAHGRFRGIPFREISFSIDCENVIFSARLKGTMPRRLTPTSNSVKSYENAC